MINKAITSVMLAFVMVVTLLVTAAPAQAAAPVKCFETYATGRTVFNQDTSGPRRYTVDASVVQDYMVCKDRRPNGVNYIRPTGYYFEYNSKVPCRSETWGGKGEGSVDFQFTTSFRGITGGVIKKMNTVKIPCSKRRTAYKGGVWRNTPKMFWFSSSNGGHPTITVKVKSNYKGFVVGVPDGKGTINQRLRPVAR